MRITRSIRANQAVRGKKTKKRDNLWVKGKGKKVITLKMKEVLHLELDRNRREEVPFLLMNFDFDLHFIMFSNEDSRS